MKGAGGVAETKTIEEEERGEEHGLLVIESGHH